MPKGYLYRFAVTMTLPAERQDRECALADAPAIAKGLKTLCKNFIFQCERGGQRHKFHYQCYLRLDERYYEGQLSTALYELFPQFAPGTIDVGAASAAGTAALKSYCMKQDATFIAGPWSDKGGPAETVKAHAPEEKYEGKDLPRDDQLFPWQRALIQFLQGEPDHRRIIWLVDKEGLAGKTALLKLLYLKFDAVPLAPASTVSSWARVLSKAKKKRVIVFNIPRTLSSKMDMDEMYSFLEQCKDGFIMSEKYDSETLCFDRPHVVVFANMFPDKKKLSADRLNVQDLSGQTRAQAANASNDFILPPSSAYFEGYVPPPEEAHLVPHVRVDSQASSSSGDVMEVWE